MPKGHAPTRSSGARGEAGRRLNLLFPSLQAKGEKRVPTLRVNLIRASIGAPSARSVVRLSYIPGLDGLRALAVIAVLLYHAGLPWVPGGFLGVEVFFVLSGYLITALMLAEWRRNGSIDLKAFWLRRARRLLPALYVLVVATLAYAVMFLPGEVAGLRDDALAAFGYVTNWYLVFAHESYFEAVGRPSLLKHLWSLAVEEQFYVLWPLVLWTAIRLGAKRRRCMVPITLGGAAASALLMAVLYVPETDPSRLYYGTDTRAAGLLVGAALAVAWRPGAMGGLWPAGRRRWGWTAPVLLDALGLLAFGVIALSCFRLGEYTPFLYRGGLASVSLATAALIMAVAHPRARLGARLFGWRPLRWIGERSYGIYLWHWPVFMVTRPQLDVDLGAVPLLALRLAATVLLAHLSYRYVERPIRTGALGRAWRSLREARGLRRRVLGIRYAGAFVPVVGVCAALGVAVAYAEPPQTPSYLATKKVHIEAPSPEPGKGETSVPAAGSSAAKEEPAPSDSARGESTQPYGRASTTGSPDRAPTGPVTAVGDSAMLGAVDPLRKEVPNLSVIDARISRQVPEAIGVLRQLRASGKLGDVVIVHIGNNGVFTADEFDEMMRVLAGVRKVLVVSVTVPDSYQWASNNEVLVDGVARYPHRAVLVDWRGVSAGHPGYFWDGIHLTPRGARVYADLIATAYEEQGR